MSDIDFNEIDKAIQKMTSGEQQKKRATQLKVKVQKRDEVAKKVEDNREQGRLATQRIIKGSTTLRANRTSGQPSSSSAKAHPPKIPAIRADGIELPSPASNSAKADKVEEPFKFSAENPALSKDQTIGELSDRYILSDFDKDEPKNKEIPESTKEGLSFEEDPEDSGFEEEEQVLTETTTEPKIYGAVHATYGQRIPNRYIPKSNPKTSSKKPSEPAKLTKKPKDNLHKKFKIWRTVSLILMLASILVWATILYLWFISG